MAVGGRGVFALLFGGFLAVAPASAAGAGPGKAVRFLPSPSPAGAAAARRVFAGVAGTLSGPGLVSTGALSPYVRTGSRSYGHGSGGFARWEARLAGPRLGIWTVRLSCLRLSTVEASAGSSAGVRRETLTFFQAALGRRLAGPLGIRVEYGRRLLRQRLRDRPAAAPGAWTLGAGFEVIF